MRNHFSLLLLASTCLALAACGGDDNSGPTAGTVTQPSATSTAAPTSAEDAARAKRGLFRLADFPAGWRTDAVNRTPTCGQYLNGLHPTTEARSAFTRQDEDNVDSVVRLFATPSEAKTALSRLDSEALRACYEREVKKRAESISEVKSGQIKVGEVKVGALSSQRYGDDSAALQIVVPLTQGQLETDLYSDSVFVQQDRALLIGNFTTQDSDFDADLMGKLLDAATARLAP